MNKIREVIRLRLSKQAGVRQIASACGIGRTTASEYVARIEAAGLSWPSAEDLSDQEQKEALFPIDRSSVKARPEPDWSVVRKELSRKGVTLTLLWKEYKQSNPDGYSYSRYTRHYQQWLRNTDCRMLQRHKAGQSLFVDWAGLTLRITDSETGEVSQAYVFVSAMGTSQYLYARVCPSMDTRNWLDAHIRAFEFYGALSEMVVPDNTKTAVEKACRYEPTLNPSYTDMAKYYGIAVIPARVRKPRDKAKVENGVQQVERWILAPLRDRTFFSVDEANEVLAPLLEQLNSKVMKGPGLSRRQLFLEEDLPAMRALPSQRYAHVEFKKAKVAPDYHIEVDGHLYSVPFTLVGKQVEIRVGIGTIEVLFGGKRVAAHLRSLSRRHPTTEPSHMPEGHKAQAEWTPERFVRWAEVTGPSTAAFVRALLEGKVHPQHGFRMCFGIMSLAKKYEVQRMEAACSKAHALGAFSYHSVKSILEKNLDCAPEQLSLMPLPTHENIRGGDYFAGAAS